MLLTKFSGSISVTCDDGNIDADYSNATCSAPSGDCNHEIFSWDSYACYVHLPVLSTGETRTLTATEGYIGWDYSGTGFADVRCDSGSITVVSSSCERADLSSFCGESVGTCADGTEHSVDCNAVGPPGTKGVFEWECEIDNSHNTVVCTGDACVVEGRVCEGDELYKHGDNADGVYKELVRSCPYGCWGGTSIQGAACHECITDDHCGDDGDEVECSANSVGLNVCKRERGEE